MAKKDEKISRRRFVAGLAAASVAVAAASTYLKYSEHVQSSQRVPKPANRKLAIGTELARFPMRPRGLAIHRFDPNSRDSWISFLQPQEESSINFLPKQKVTPSSNTPTYHFELRQARAGETACLGHFLLLPQQFARGDPHVSIANQDPDLQHLRYDRRLARIGPGPRGLVWELLETKLNRPRTSPVINPLVVYRDTRPSQDTFLFRPVAANRDYFVLSCVPSVSGTEYMVLPRQTNPTTLLSYKDATTLTLPATLPPEKVPEYVRNKLPADAAQLVVGGILKDKYIAQARKALGIPHGSAYHLEDLSKDNELAIGTVPLTIRGLRGPKRVYAIWQATVPKPTTKPTTQKSKK